jgi:transcriptional regulator with XRE-family HTH domain
MDISLVIRRRLKELGLEQKDLAVAAEVTESYISQLLASKKVPPAPERTDIYDKIGPFLKLRSGELSKLANVQRKEALRQKVADPPRPLFREVRALILDKCAPRKRKQIRAIFEKEPFGELERLITQKLLDVAKKVAKEELESETWLRLVARLGKRSYEEMRVMILEFLDTDVFHVSIENCLSFLEPLIESWNIDLENFGVEVVLNRRLALERIKRFEFLEKKAERPEAPQPGLDEFLKNASLSGDTTPEEVDFLKSLKFKGRRPTAIYYYRELQNLRDPLHFVDPVSKPPR